MPHIHSIYDTDQHFIIDPINRKITSESGKITLMQNDHLSERFTFEIPRYIEGHDMSITDKVEVHYLNASSANKQTQSKDVYEVADLQISPDSTDMVICSWLISKNATMYQGSLNFAVRFVCFDGDEISYQWFTDIHTGIKVLSPIYNMDYMESTYDIDVVENWKRDIIQAFYESSVYADTVRYKNEAGVSASSAAQSATSARLSAMEASQSEATILAAETRINESIEVAEELNTNVEYIREQIDTANTWVDRAIGYADEAAESARKAKASATTAKDSEDRSKIYASNAQASATQAAGSVNAVRTSATNAANSARAAASSATDAHVALVESEAVEARVRQSELDARASAQSASQSVSQADQNFKMAKSYAVGATGLRNGENTDNAMYYAETAESVRDEALSTLNEIKEIETEITRKVSETSFNVNLETGELEYDSQNYEFTVNGETGNLEWEVL